MTLPENLYRGELVAFPGSWAFQIGKSAIILVSDDEFEQLADPDRKLNLSLTHEPKLESLRDICQHAKDKGQRTLILSFDHFFSQYRPGQAGKPRRLMPDMDEYIQRVATISRFAQGYGLGLELSLLSPLEIGRAYAARTGESGTWLHYRKGLRDPVSGTFSVQLWQQKRWVNNKGPIDIEDAGIRVFAFREEKIDGTPYRSVAPEDIVEITGDVCVERWKDLSSASGDYRAQRIRVFGKGMSGGKRNRALVVQQYRTPEMDYFSPRALPFLNDLVDRYADAGVKLNALYSDEMHIQQDWAYFNHHDHGEFALRYVSKGLAKRFAEQYGEQYRDLAKYMIYFACGQDDFANDLTAKSGVMHVFGASAKAIQETALFRSRYYRLLQDGVVDLFVQAKHHTEQRMGHRLEARAHATWAESPTIDRWNTGRQNDNANKYEYTSNFLWSNTVHQAASACHDYFRWGDFLTGNGNDHAEGGWLDRNYYGLALACSTGILNEVPYSYAAHWGMPTEINRRRAALVDAFGAAAVMIDQNGVCPLPIHGAAQDMEHRDVEVLMLYPLDLVAADERFGSWTTQYAYANQVTASMLLERGKVVRGAIEMAGRRFTTLVATFEPFPSRRLLAMMRQFVESCGRLIWSGPPPLLTAEGKPALEEWRKLFGVEYAPNPGGGELAPGREVRFQGVLSKVSPQIILTDFLVDRIHPVVPLSGTSIVARVKSAVVGTHRKLRRGGSATFLGYRPRDDQSRSLGYETRNCFEVLSALGAYRTQDNTEYLSRTTPFLCCRFPNGAVSIAPHFREIEEAWPGGFARNKKEDDACLKKCPLPSEALELKDFKVNGHTVTFRGQQAMTFRVDKKANLIAFAGSGCWQVTIDGRTFRFADRDLKHIGWAPVHESRRVKGGAIFQIVVVGSGRVSIPAATLPKSLALVIEGPTPGSHGQTVPCRQNGAELVFEVKEEISGRWIYGISA